MISVKYAIIALKEFLNIVIYLCMGNAVNDT